MARSRLTLLATGLAVFLFFSYFLIPSSPDDISESPYTADLSAHHAAPDAAIAGDVIGSLHVSAELLAGEAIMPKLGNETIKAELGRASWKLLHTTLGRFPKKPSADEREALSSYLHLFARLYPCGECATHFRLLLKKFPPQTSSRDSAAQWGCHVHNEVNKRLKKPVFDCASVAEVYKCGCAGADKEDEEREKKEKKEEGGVRKGTKGITEELTKKAEAPAEEEMDALERNVAKSQAMGAKVEIHREGIMNGG